MKAMVCTQYGPPDVLQLIEMPTPKLKDDELLIRIFATSVTAADFRIRGLNVPTGFALLMRLALGIRGPRQPILGGNFAGVVESVGAQVQGYKKGDRVFGTSGMKMATYAEFICLKHDSTVALMPKGMNYNEGAALPFGTFTALFFLRDKGHIQAGNKLLIYGASGSVGTAAVQLGKYFGAHVTAVCSASNAAMVKQLGADRVLDYQVQDFTETPERYDIIFDTVGKTHYARSLKSLKPRGSYLLAVAGLPTQLRALWTSLSTPQRVNAGVATEKKEDLDLLIALFEAGQLTPVIDRHYPFEQLAAAHGYAEQGHKKGNVVITLVDDIAVDAT